MLKYSKYYVPFVVQMKELPIVYYLYNTIFNKNANLGEVINQLFELNPGLKEYNVCLPCFILFLRCAMQVPQGGHAVPTPLLPEQLINHEMNIHKETIFSCSPMNDPKELV